MNKTDFCNSKYVVYEEKYVGAYGVTGGYHIVAVNGFADEKSALAYMSSRPTEIYFLTHGPYATQKPKPIESELTFFV